MGFQCSIVLDYFNLGLCWCSLGLIVNTVDSGLFRLGIDSDSGDFIRAELFRVRRNHIRLLGFWLMVLGLSTLHHIWTD